ncbi:hypothetical protein COO60DRAFT_1699579 [Scenedesmus sp. NREL 46B-D3]|nr:hypothetical protein COO60DRAFT_1699579 [Scenedesmus sp. NREL 46B-D3]
MQPAADELPPVGASSATSFTTADGDGLTPRMPSQRAEDVFAGQPTFSLGPIDLHAGGLVRQFRLRQRFSLADKLEAAAGLAYDRQSGRLRPTASLTYRLDAANHKSRIELSSTDRKLLARKGWQVGFRGGGRKGIGGHSVREDGGRFRAGRSGGQGRGSIGAGAEPHANVMTAGVAGVKIRQATVGVSAEASLSLQDPRAGPAAAAKPPQATDPGSSRSSSNFLAGLSRISSSVHPDLHLSLDSVKPLQYELIGIGLVLLLNMPLKLNNQEAEFGGPWGLRQLKGFGRASLKRTGFMRWKLGAQEASAVLDIGA